MFSWNVKWDEFPRMSREISACAPGPVTSTLLDNGAGEEWCNLMSVPGVRRGIMRGFNETPDTSQVNEWSFWLIIRCMVFYWDSLMWLAGQTPDLDRKIGGKLAYLCPALSSGAPWAVIMIVFWPTLGGVGLDTSPRPGKGHPWWSLFSNVCIDMTKTKYG